MIQPGEIALFDIGAALRPFLVVTANGDNTYSGELFLDYEKDRTEWVLRNIKRPPHENARSCWLRNVQEGIDTGTIRGKVRK